MVRHSYTFCAQREPESQLTPSQLQPSSMGTTSRACIVHVSLHHASSRACIPLCVLALHTLTREHYRLSLNESVTVTRVHYLQSITGCMNQVIRVACTPYAVHSK